MDRLYPLKYEVDPTTHLGVLVLIVAVVAAIVGAYIAYRRRP